jgi:hypothetical protein
VTTETILKKRTGAFQVMDRHDAWPMNGPSADTLFSFTYQKGMPNSSAADGSFSYLIASQPVEDVNNQASLPGEQQMSDQNVL